MNYSSIVQQLYSTSLDGVIVMDNLGLIVEFNPSAEVIFGHKREEVLGKAMADIIIPPHLREHHKKGMENYIRTGEKRIIGKRIEIQAMHSSGTFIQIELTVNVLHFTGTPLYLAFLRDITEEKMKEQELLNFNQQLISLNHELNKEKLAIQEQKDIIQCILESSHEGKIKVDLNGTIIFVNTSVQKLFNYQSLIGQNIIEVFTQFFIDYNKIIESTRCLLIEKGEQINERFTIYDKNNETSYFEIYSNPIKDKMLRKHGYLFVFRNRTKEEKVDRLKNEFISIVSHELRTPLSSILGFMEILLNRNLTEERKEKYYKNVYKEANRLAKLVNDFLDIQKMESGRLEYNFSLINIKELIEEVVNYWSNCDCEINVLYEKEEFLAYLDADRIKQVFHNLISNAIKYSPHSKLINIKISEYKCMVKVEIQDFGLGIPCQVGEKIFERFYRVDTTDRQKVKGTGLGLTICKEIVDEHFGSLSYYSKLGEGTTFILELPTKMLHNL